MAYSFISLDQQDAVLVLTIQRPDQLKAMNKTTIEELNSS